jgi:hypothetical protein
MFVLAQGYNPRPQHAGSSGSLPLVVEVAGLMNIATSSGPTHSKEG